MDKKKLLLWDADYIAYKHRKEDSLNEAIKKVDEHINYILTFSNADAYAMFISEGKYFRHDVAFEKKHYESLYKINRGISQQPWIKIIKEYLKVKYGAISYKNAEADDAVVYWNNKELYCYTDNIISINPNIAELDEKGKLVETIIVATDKDILYNIPGKHINPVKKNKDTNEWESVWIETCEQSAKKGIWYQMVTGDIADSIKGLTRKGKAWCDKHFQNLKIEEIRSLVLCEYINEYGESNGIFKFQKNYRLLKMLEIDEDWLREVGYVPNIDNINYIEKQESKQFEINF